MAKVVITIEDLEDDEIDLHMDFMPALNRSNPSPAQRSAMMLLQAVREDAEPGSFEMQAITKE